MEGAARVGADLPYGQVAEEEDELHHTCHDPLQAGHHILQLLHLPVARAECPLERRHPLNACLHSCSH